MRRTNPLTRKTPVFDAEIWPDGDLDLPEERPLTGEEVDELVKQHITLNPDE